MVFFRLTVIFLVTNVTNIFSKLFVEFGNLFFQFLYADYGEVGGPLTSVHLVKQAEVDFGSLVFGFLLTFSDDDRGWFFFFFALFVWRWYSFDCLPEVLDVAGFEVFQSVCMLFVV